MDNKEKLEQQLENLLMEIQVLIVNNKCLQKEDMIVICYKCGSRNIDFGPYGSGAHCLECGLPLYG